MQSPGSSPYAAAPAGYLYAPVTNLNQARLAHMPGGSPTPAPVFDLACPMLFQCPCSMPMAVGPGNNQAIIPPCSPLTGLQDNFPTHELTMTPVKSFHAHDDPTQTYSPGETIAVGREALSSRIDIGSPTPNLEPQSIPNIATEYPKTPTQNKQLRNSSSRALKRKPSVVADGNISQGTTRLLPERHERKQNFACDLCRKLKIRCVFYPGKAKCMRCERSDVECLDGSSMRAAAAAARARQGLRKRRKKSGDPEEPCSDPEPAIFTTKTIRTRPVADVYDEVIDDAKSGIQLGSLVQVKKSSQHHYKTKERQVTRVVCKVVAVYLDGAETNPIPCSLVRLSEKHQPSKISDPGGLIKDERFDQKHPSKLLNGGTPVLRKGTTNLGLDPDPAQSSSSGMSDLHELRDDYILQTPQPQSSIGYSMNFQAGESAEAALTHDTVLMPTTANENELRAEETNGNSLPTTDFPPLLPVSSFQEFTTIFTPNEFNFFEPDLPQDKSQLSRAFEPRVSSSISVGDESSKTCLKLVEDRQNSLRHPINTTDFLRDQELSSPLRTYEKCSGKSIFPSNSLQNIDSASSPTGTCVSPSSIFNSPMQMNGNCFPTKDGNDFRRAKNSHRLPQRSSSPLGQEGLRLSRKNQLPDKSFMFFYTLNSLIHNSCPTNSTMGGIIDLEANRLQKDLASLKSKGHDFQNSLSNGKEIKIVDFEIGSSSRVHPPPLDTYTSNRTVFSSQNLSNEKKIANQERRGQHGYYAVDSPKIQGTSDTRKDLGFLPSFSVPEPPFNCEVSFVNQPEFS